MENIIDLLYQMAPYAHFISFGILMLSGLSLPISEDVVIIVAGSIAATIIPENKVIIFIGCYAGALISDWIPYSLGRFFGPSIFKISLFQKLLPEHKIKKIEKYFEKYHAKTLFLGRFIPFGVRNVLFFTTGLVQTRFIKFLTVDVCALTITSLIQFTIGYTLGENYKEIFPYLNRYKIIVISIFFVIIIAFYVRKRYLKKYFNAIK